MRDPRDERIAELEVRVRSLEAQLGRTAKQPDAGDEDLSQAIEQLLARCRARGVHANLPESASRREVLQAWSNVCLEHGLVNEAQYLAYLELPYD
jgi:hypothetical protein